MVEVEGLAFHIVAGGEIIERHDAAVALAPGRERRIDIVPRRHGVRSTLTVLAGRDWPTSRWTVSWSAPTRSAGGGGFRAARADSDRGGPTGSGISAGIAAVDGSDEAFTITR
jgi:hypothetical protein